MVGNLANSSVLEAPILLLVCFHKALRAEFDGIYQTISDFDSDLDYERREIVVELQQRFQFLKLAYQYHSKAEDEIIFQALDARVANVTCTYYLEHNDIDDLFESVFQSLNVLLEKDEKCFDYSKRFQELVDSTSTIQTSICQHMFKEEEQIFPLLVHHFSFREQASLVWQFFSSVPIILLEDFLPWMMSYLPLDEQADVVHCIKEIVPKDKLLQEVVASWLGKRNQRSPISFSSINDEAILNSYNSFYVKKVHRTYISWSSSYKESCIQGEFDCLLDNVKSYLVDSLCIWHGAIRKYLKEVLEELYDIRTSKVFSNLSSVGGQLKFLADVLTFYSDALENVLFPMLREFSKSCISFSNKRFPNASQISLLRVLQNIDIHNRTSLCKIVDDLFQQLEALLEEISENFTFQELEVFPRIRKHCNNNMQKKLLYLSLHIMPLGLLKCVITWLLSHLNEDESKAAIRNIQLAGSDLDMSFASLLHKWVCVGYSKKISHGTFKRELQEIFSNKSYYLAKNIEERAEFVDLNSFPVGRFLPDQVKSNSTDKAKKGALVSSPQNIKPKIYFPEIFKKVSPFSQYLADKGDVGSSLKPEFKPVDYMFLFHKALSNDLNYLVHESTKLIEDITLFENFRQRFDLVRFLCQIHSENEDKFAFPALEAKGQLQNISLSYTMDHKLETECFSQISIILDKISKLHASLPSKLSLVKDQRILKYHHLCMKLHSKCKTICITLGKHFQREEIELWPLFTEYFTDEEQDKIIGSILGNTRAEVLQQMIPWLMASLSPGEQHAMMSLWRKATKNTMFAEWLAEWWEGMTISNIDPVEEESTILPWVVDPLEIVATYLSKKSHFHGSELRCGDVKFQEEVAVDDDVKLRENGDGDDQTKHPIMQTYTEANQFSELDELQRRTCCDHITNEVNTLTVQVSKQGEDLSATQRLRHLEDHVLTMNQEDFEAAIIRVCHDTSLDAEKKTSICQLLRTSRWTVSQQKHREEIILSSNDGEYPGQFPSYRDPSTFGCKHYKRNCKVFAPCCEKLFTCRYCHDEATGHPMDRKSTTKMMCMKCLKVQPVAATCSTISCNDLSMGKYFCGICRLYDDEREIYHCPYCNLCRLGKGLGIDFFHCMRCNACLSVSLTVHVCREKGFESNCPICHEDIFTSSSPVKALPCGHMMHSTCFQDYTCMHYTCPICSKSLGDMQVYFRMLDAYLAEAKIPEEYHGQNQGILCNDCEKRGTAPFHWHHHKCSICGSYNTRLL
ncbi:hypothetical protein ACHQM5_008662 [Ranunculus cassubicifolius]